MRSFAWVVALAAWAACAASQTPTPRSTFTADDDAAVRAVLAAQMDAWNRGDLEGFLDGYARVPELVFTSGARIRRGWQETNDSFRSRYGEAKETMGRLTFEVLGVQPVGGDGAVVLGRWGLDGPNAGGGVFSVVLERRSEGWKVIHDHTSSEAPTAPAVP